MSVSENAGLEATHRKLFREPAWGSLLVSVLVDLEDEQQAGSLVHVFGQFQVSRPLTVYDAHAAALIKTAPVAGDLLCSQVPLDMTAGLNHKKVYNQQLLSGLPEPFSAHFLGSSSDADGHV